MRHHSLSQLQKKYNLDTASGETTHSIAMRMMIIHSSLWDTFCRVLGRSYWGYGIQLSDPQVMWQVRKVGTYSALQVLQSALNLEAVV